MNKRFENVNDTQVDLQQTEVNDGKNIQNDLAGEQGVDLNAIENQDQNTLPTNQKKGMSKAFYYPPPPPPPPADTAIYVDAPIDTKPNLADGYRALNENFNDIAGPISEAGERRRRLQQEMEASNAVNNEGTAFTIDTSNLILNEEEKQTLNTLGEKHPEYNIIYPQNESIDTSSENTNSTETTEATETLSEDDTE